MTFLEAVNRILRITTVMQWDDDDIATFSSTQHAGNIALCRQAIQHVVNELTADQFLWPEDAEDNLTLVSGQRTYSLASDFVRFQDEDPFLFRLTGAVGTDGDGSWVSEYRGGKDAIERAIPTFLSDTGPAQWFYFDGDRTIGLYPVPGTDENGTVLRYSYEKGVMVSSESDSLPLDSNNNDAKSMALCDMAARVFVFLKARQPIEGLTNDAIYGKAKAVLMQLNRKAPPCRRYGYRYE